jgi:hypothetical protein
MEEMQTAGVRLLCCCCLLYTEGSRADRRAAESEDLLLPHLCLHLRYLTVAVSLSLCLFVSCSLFYLSRFPVARYA